MTLILMHLNHIINDFGLMQLIIDMTYMIIPLNQTLDFKEQLTNKKVLIV
jgi:hypothetical protein